MISWKNKTAAAARSLLSCPTLCNPIDGRPPGSPVPGILQARTQEWIAISFSNAWIWKVKLKSLSRVWLLATPWTAAHQAPPSMGFSTQPTPIFLGFLAAQLVKNLPAMQETWVRSLSWEDSLEKEKATQPQYSGLENSMCVYTHTHTYTN